MNHSVSARRGYVHGLFRIFHLTDIPCQEIPLHFHDFRKMVILLQGNIFYDIEGRRYPLEAGDLVLVDAGELHRPVLSTDPGSTYERIIIYFSDEYLNSHADAGLDQCFRLLKQGLPPVIRGRSLPEDLQTRLIPGLAESIPDNPAAEQLMQRCRLTELLLQLNLSLTDRQSAFRDPVTRNPAVQQLMLYLTEHLTDSLNIEDAARLVHLDRSYLMHVFKAETGSSIMSYVTEKRLFLAQNMLLQGIPACDVCYRSGFTNYTSFYRAYRNRYGCSPRSGLRAAAIDPGLE